MHLTYLNETDTEINEEIFQQILTRLKEIQTNPSEKPETFEVELLLTSDEEIQKLNKKYRDKDTPTDVLSFPNSLPGKGLPSQTNSLGQIIISLPRAQDQAKDLGQSTEDELKFLFAHGLAHLLGHDHQTPEEEAAMLALVYKIINRQCSKN